MSSSWAEILRQVSERAEGRCEYCRMHDALQGATFHVEHIVPRSLGGKSRLENLAWACPRCNLCKSNRVEAEDPQCGQLVRIFHPRKDRWSDHFRWEGYTIVPLTPIGRATVAAMDFNNPRKIRIRQVEESFDLFPPDEEQRDG